MRYGFSPSRGSGASGGCERCGPGQGAEQATALWVRGEELGALGRAVRELRARRGLSQEGLGVAARLHRNYVGTIERGEQNITFRVLLLLVHGLDVPLSELVALYERNRFVRTQAAGRSGRRTRSALHPEG